MFRYRRLIASRDAEGVAALRGHYSRNSTSPSDDIDAAMRAEAEAPLKVDAVEGEGSQEELEALLRARKLMPGDLVFSNGAWTTLADAPEFFELCADLGDSRARGQGFASTASFVFKGLAGAFTALLRAVVGYK